MTNKKDQLIEIGLFEEILGPRHRDLVLDLIVNETHREGFLAAEHPLRGPEEVTNGLLFTFYQEMLIQGMNRGQAGKLMSSLSVYLQRTDTTDVPHVLAHLPVFERYYPTMGVRDEGLVVYRREGYPRGEGRVMRIGGIQRASEEHRPYLYVVEALRAEEWEPIPLIPLADLVTYLNRPVEHHAVRTYQEPI